MGDLEGQVHGSSSDGGDDQSPSIFRSANCPVTLKFEEVMYKIKEKKGERWPCGEKSLAAERMILKGISGTVLPGEMLAMLGPSGSGKTTLLTALGGRLGRRLDGIITYNDKPFSNVMKRNTGFVTQDDVLYPHLTVTETLVYTALLRLPNTFTKQEKTAHAETVIAQLGLTKCKSSIIGDELLRGISGGVSDNKGQDPAQVKQALVTAYKSNIAGSLKVETQKLSHQFEENKLDNKQSCRWTTTWWQQFSVLLQRGLKERRHEAFSALRITQVLVVALICGLLWWKSKNFQDRIGLLFFYTGFWSFFPVFQAIFTFPQERSMLTKERSSGMYRLSAYFISRIVGDLPMELVLPTVFLTITYWMAGLKPSLINFFETLFVLLYSVVAAQGLGLALGALVMDLKAATTLGSVLLLTFLLSGGYYVTQVPKFISWIKYISLTQYSFKLLVSSQYKADETYDCGANMNCTVGSHPMVKSVGMDNIAFAIVALGIMVVGYRLIAYAALTRIGVTRQ
ncbi:hypothetical protein Syun_008333 [Stephania yunnanensis]|uniref:ABC transporter domain-containing protein n=1 Tax=Stephania yunnanensis TaxID=152371 RepID=A0AAP0PPH2_9MAGN